MSASPFARRALVVGLVGAAAQLALLVWATFDRPGFLPLGLIVYAFTAGPPLYVGVLAWRRRAHPTRPEGLFRLVFVLAAIGIPVLAVLVYQYRTDAAARAAGEGRLLLVPLVQWLPVLAAWATLVRREGAEKRAAADAGKRA